MSARIVLCLVICGLLACAGNSRAPIEDRATAAPQPQDSSYIVKRGDTLYSIAFRYGKDFRQVAAANGIAAPYTIYPGQRINLAEAPRPQVATLPPVSVFPAGATPSATPRPASVPVPAPLPASTPRPFPSPATGRSLPPLSPPASAPISSGAAVSTPSTGLTAETAVSTPLPTPAPISNPPLPQITQPQVVSPGQAAVTVPGPAPVPESGRPAPDSKPKSSEETFAGEKVTAWRWPTSGPVIRGYSESVHKGIDIGGARGDPITAVAAGKVVYAGSGIAGFGELLIIKHNDVYLSAYGHNEELLVAEGDRVAVGQTIAQKGSSGTDSVKLHFEIRQEGKPIDPQRLLPGR